MRRHGLDAISLVFGVIFAATGAVFLFGTVDISRIPPAWSWPIPLMIVGALIILLAVRRDRPAGTIEAPPTAAGGWDPATPPRHTAELPEWPAAEKPELAEPWPPAEETSTPNDEQ
jgi:hypothetical protein